MKPFFSNTRLLAFGLTMGALSTLTGCDEVAEQCNLGCPDDGFAEGNASISGIASVDAFFGAAIDVNAAMADLDAKLRAELDGIAVSVGLEPGAGGAQISAALRAQIEANVSGGLSIDYQPPKCEASVEASFAAAAECDVDVEPGTASFQCYGSCEAEAGVEVDCGASAQLVCTGTAPNLECSGTCTGECAVDLSVAGSCEGTCKGSCSAFGDTQGFEGRCDGMCTGECVLELEAGASCEGRCEGTCEYTPPEAQCDATAEAKCEAMGNASIECEAGCEGEFDPPQVSAECEATVEAKASASVSCTPPALAINYTFAAGVAGDVEAEAEFKAWLQGFRGHLSAMAALRVEAQGVFEASGVLVDAGADAVTNLVGSLSTDFNIQVAAGAACAINEVPKVSTGLTTNLEALQGSISATGSVFAEVGM